jgi:hypothetical protein
MLAKFPERAALGGLGPKLSASVGALVAAEQAFDAGSDVVVAARVGMRHADLKADQGVRSSLRAVQSADSMLGKKLTPQLFPNGVTPIVRPIGSAEVSELRDLDGRLDALASAWPDAATEKAKLVALRTAYEAAISARREALQALSNPARRARGLSERVRRSGGPGQGGVSARPGDAGLDLQFGFTPSGFKQLAMIFRSEVVAK